MVRRRIPVTQDSMKKCINIPGILLLFFAGTVVAGAQTVSLAVGKGKAARGGTTRGFVVMNIPKGLHVNSNRPKSEFAIPTRVTVTAVGATVGKVSYPPGRSYTFAFSDEPISVYVGRVRFGFNVSVPARFRGSSVRVKATVRYQACTDEVCYAPKTKTLTLDVPVK